MKLYDECRDCLYNSQMKKVESVYGDDQRMQSFKEAVRALCDGAPDNWCAPLLMRAIDGVHQSIFGGDNRLFRAKNHLQRRPVGIGGGYICPHMLGGRPR